MSFEIKVGNPVITSIEVDPFDKDGDMCIEMESYKHEEKVAIYLSKDQAKALADYINQQINETQ